MISSCPRFARIEDMKCSPVFLLLFALVACTTKPDQSHRLHRADSARMELDRFFQTAFPTGEPGGAALILSGDCVVYSGAWGLADLQTREPVTTKTLFNLGSVSKTFVGFGILRLRDEGELKLSDSLIKYFPEFRNKDIAQRVQISHLLTHTSGLPDIRFPYQDSVFYLTAKDAENWAPIMKANKLNFEPGSRFEYSNPAFNALALIIEQVSGKKWQDYITEKILRPSGMSTSTITDGAHPESGVAHGYIFSRGQWLEKDYMEEPTFAASGNGGIWSSVEELARYELAIRESVFLQSSTIEESRSPKRFAQMSDTTQAKLGWSWFIGKTQDGYKTAGHTGSQGGFRANYLVIPEKKQLLILLSASPRPLEEYTSHMLEFLRRL